MRYFLLLFKMPVLLCVVSNGRFVLVVRTATSQSCQTHGFSRDDVFGFGVLQPRWEFRRRKKGGMNNQTTSTFYVHMVINASRVYLISACWFSQQLHLLLREHFWEAAH